MSLYAQTADVLGSSTGILGLILTGALGAVFFSTYKFSVKFRTTERILSRQRIQEAIRGQRLALQEAQLWQAYCADLEYALRQNGVKVPGVPQKLQQIIDQEVEPLPDVRFDDADEK